MSTAVFSFLSHSENKTWTIEPAGKTGIVIVRIYDLLGITLNRMLSCTFFKTQLPIGFFLLGQIGLPVRHEIGDTERPTRKNWIMDVRYGDFLLGAVQCHYGFNGAAPKAPNPASKNVS